VRTPLADNYETYTYHLFLLIARVNHADPVAVRNDDPMPGNVEVPAFFVRSREA
jgi:para-aminobenzoate synthetase